MTRPRLQLHLSTLLIVTALAAGLLWLNMRDDAGPGFNTIPSTFHCSGWPLYVQQRNIELNIDRWDWRALTCNAAICLSLLAVAAAAIERATRRMKRGGP
jgi:hypothetical protein